MTTARTASSFSSASSAASISSSVATESVLAGGRLTVMTATPAWASTRMLLYVAVASAILLVLQKAATGFLTQGAGGNEFLQRAVRRIIVAELRLHGGELFEDGVQTDGVCHFQRADGKSGSGAHRHVNVLGRRDAFVEQAAGLRD